MVLAVLGVLFNISQSIVLELTSYAGSCKSPNDVLGFKVILVTSVGLVDSEAPVVWVRSGVMSGGHASTLAVLTEDKLTLVKGSRLFAKNLAKPHKQIFS